MEEKKLPKAIEFLAGHGLTVVCLICLMVLTLVGTIDQKFIGLFQSQQKYFYSIFVYYHLFDTANSSVYVPVFPGGTLILSVLFVNLLTAFIYKFRLRRRIVGMWICHIGIFLLLLGSFLSFRFSTEGHLTLLEGEQSDEFVSYHYREFVVSDATHEDMGEQASFPHEILAPGKTLTSSRFPFSVHVKGFYRNCIAMRSSWRRPSKTGQEYYLKVLKPELENEKNHPGALVQVQRNGHSIGDFYIFAEIPVEFNFHGKKYRLELRKQRTEIPFTIRLLKFTHEVYPGTTTPKHFESKVKVIERQVVDGETIESTRPVLISMNRPLRHMGYTFYQSSYAEENNQKYSTLAVVQTPNPFPQWPELGAYLEKWPHFSCLLIALGMLIHFLPKLFRFVGQKQ